jgi:hypothetical protein
MYGKTTFINNITYTSVTENISQGKADKVCHKSYKHPSAYQILFII